MAHFAKINEQNIVEDVLVVSDEHEANGEEFLNSLGLIGRWIQTSYNNNIRKQFAAIGYTYNEDADVFVSMKPFDGWTLDANFDWQPPIAKPEDGKDYTWDNESLSWIELVTPAE